MKIWISRHGTSHTRVIKQDSCSKPKCTSTSIYSHAATLFLIASKSTFSTSNSKQKHFCNRSSCFSTFLLLKEDMASQDQSYKAGEAKGQSEEKTNQTLELMQEKAREANDKTSETTQAAKDKTSQTAQAAKDKTSEKAQQAKEKTSETTEATRQKAQETGLAAGEKAEAGKEKTGGILQKTGEQLKSVAQGAADAVKHTFGFDKTGENPDEHHYNDSTAYNKRT